MITTKADKLLKSLIDAGLSLTEFTILATKILRIQRNFNIDNEDRRQRDRLRQQIKLREQNFFEQQLKDEEQRKFQSLNKLREFGYVTNENLIQIPNNQIKTKDNQIEFNYSKEINHIKQKQKECCLTFNIDYDLRRNQQTLERACKRAKRNIYELRAERFNHPEFRSVLSVETITFYNKLKDGIREINKIFLESKSDQDKRYLQELLTYINQYEGNIDLLMCQMQYEPKVKETILFSPVTTDILDRMNLILHQVRTLANQISTCDYLNENLNEEEILHDQSTTIPTKVNYIIKIKTNDQISSSLSDETNVNIKLYGTYNKSPDINLMQSINKIKWQSGQIDLFNIELNYLGDIYAIEIWHNSQYSSWKVDWIEIIDDGANIYRFPLDRLFDKYSDEKKIRYIIQRDIGPVNRLPIKPLKQIKSYNQIGFSTYTVQVKTGKQPNKVTDSSIFIQLKGENGSFSDQLCSANSAFKSSVFEPDQLDTFYLVWPHLAKINSLNLLVKSEGIQPSWFCEYINIEDGQTGEKYKFLVNQLFNGSNPDDPNLKRDLTVYPEKTIEKDTKNDKDEKPGYLMKIKTGEKGLSNMNTIPPINLILKGEKEKSEPYTLKSSDNQRKLFQENQIDQFIIPPKYYIGPIKNLQLSSNTQLDQWFIENIIIRDITQGKDYIFPIYKWFNTQDGTNNLSIQPINERKADYKVYTRTIASELKGPDRSIKLLLQGTKGKQEVELNNPITMSNTFQPGHKDEYYLENIKSLGDLQSIQVDITHPNIKKLGLDYIEIKDLTTNDSYRFNINRMLDSKNPKMVAKAELIPRSTVNPPSSKINSNQQQTLSNRTNFDQIVKNVPQGARRVDNKSKIDEENKSISTIENSSSEIDENELIDNSSKKDNYQIKIKTINKEFLDKDTKLQVNLIDENGQTISNQRENNLQKGKIDTFVIDTPKDFGKLKNIKLSLTESKSKKKNLYQPESIEIYHPITNNTHRIDYTTDDILNSDKNQLELTKSIQPHSDINIREEIQPQGAALSPTTTNKSPYRIVSENDEENYSLPNQTTTTTTSSSISENLSEKISNRQIQPGDRVKNNKDYRYEPKQIQLISNKQHLSQTKFDQRQADLIQNKYNDDENQQINRQISKEKKINLLPKQSSSYSLKQQNMMAKAASKLPTNKEQLLNEMINVKTRTDLSKISINQKQNSDHQIQENYSISIKEQQKTKDKSKPITRISSSSNSKQLLSQTNITDDLTNAIIINESRTLSNTSQLTKPNTITFEESKPTTQSRIENKKQSTDIPARRSQSASSSRTVSSIISKGQSQELINISSSSTKSKTQSKSSIRTNNSFNQLNQISTVNKTPSDSSSISTKGKTPSRPQVNMIDSTFNEYHLQPNTQNISSVTIHTIATKSDSDLHSTRKSIDDRESEHSLEKKSLLSPDNTKKSRKNTSKTSESTQNKLTSVSSPLNISPDASPSSTKNQYLSKETSDIQYASRPPSSKSWSNHPPVSIDRERSDTINEKEEQHHDLVSKQNHSYINEPLTQKVSNSDEIKSKQSSIESHSTSKYSSNTSKSTISTQSQSLSHAISNVKHPITPTNPSTNSNLSTKLTEIDHMSTVYEESEPSSISIPHVVTSSLHKHDIKVNHQDRLEKSSNPSSSQAILSHNHKNKTSSIEKSLSSLLRKSSRGSNNHKKTINAKTILTSSKSNTSIDYEFRVQTGNESQLDGTNEHVSIELINTKEQSMIIPLVNSMNNSKPFQKGQLDIFHLNLPNHFHNIKQINLSLPQTTKDPLHIRYCELQDRQTMNTLYFSIEQWLGENNIYNVEMHLNNSLF